MNRNTLYAQILVDELVRAGLRQVCLSPGSRNTPLVLAFAQHPQIKVTSHLDERSAAFFALGMAIGLNAPVALLCTSGSAAANYFPAIVEAHQSRVPLIVLTADRPPELRHSGANQTIDQIKMYGGYALWSVDAALPEAAPTALSIRNLRTLAARAFAVANGEQQRKGVVHVNLPFRPPLEPLAVTSDVTTVPTGALAREGVYVHMPAPEPLPISAGLAQHLTQLLRDTPNGVIVCGPMWHASKEFAAQVIALARQVGYPVFADPLSGVRFGQRDAISGYESFMHPQSAVLADLPKPKLALRFGDVPTAKWLNQFLDQAAPQHVIHVSRDGVWADDSHRVSEFVHADEGCFLQALSEAWGEGCRALGGSQEGWMRAETAARTEWQCALDNGAWFDGVAVHDVIELLPEGATLFAGNSLPVRHVEQFGVPTDRHLIVHANRGASGIDGNVSTALGLGHARPEHPLVAIIGDVTLYHDMNGLLAVRRCGVPITLVLLNNNGGGIFHRLGVKDYEPAFTKYFVTPHDLDYSHVAHLYGLTHIVATSRAHFREAFATSIAQRVSTLIEVRTNALDDLAERSKVIAAL